MQKQAQGTQVWQPLHPTSPTNTHSEWRCQPTTQLVNSAPLDPKLHQPAAVTDQQLQEVEQSAVPEIVQHQQGSVQCQTISPEQSEQQTKTQQVKQRPAPEQVAEKSQTGKKQPEKLPQQASVKQQVVKLQPKKATKQVNDIRVTAQQQPEKLPKQVLRLRSPLSRYLQSSIQANSSLRSCVNR